MRSVSWNAWGSGWYLEIEWNFPANVIENGSGESVSKSILLPLKHYKAKQHNIILTSLAKENYRINFKSCINLTLTEYFCKINALVKAFNEHTSITIKCSTGQILFKRNK